jgi:hypothetical protein
MTKMIRVCARSNVEGVQEVREERKSSRVWHGGVTEGIFNKKDTLRRDRKP